MSTMQKSRPDLFAYLFVGARFLVPTGQRKRFSRVCRKHQIEIKTFFDGNKAWVRRIGNDSPYDSAYDVLLKAGFEQLAPIP